jgi:hypothetical protein
MKRFTISLSVAILLGLTAAQATQTTQAQGSAGLTSGYGLG